MSPTEEETERHNDNTCMFPGCDRLAVESTERGFGESYKPRYCDLDEHNAGNLHQEMAKKDGSGDAPA